ncbi:hypothetical protein [Prescottella equi]|uniref:hypothetical protein n=1 Tax=Rhodococcus hoagii TaxID=43767 RepID=UPI001F5BFEB6|nr:hypothetical protein [Prescottella equi]UNQ33890.1 hypothetical protein MPC39_17630 [Prescottella equi]
MGETVNSNEDATDAKLDDGGQPAPMKTWERWVAGIIGLATSGAGIAAVFISDNQAGTAALFVIAVAFLLIGVQGTPLKRFASGDHSAEFDRRAARNKLEEAIEAKKDGDQETAEVLVDDAVRIDPSVENLPVVQAVRYERRVADALRRVFGRTHNFELIAAETWPAHAVAQMNRSVLRPDFVLSTDGNQINVEVKYLQGALTMSHIRQLMDMAVGTGTPTLLITNAPLSNAAMQFNGANQNTPLEVVQWSGGNDDDLLERAALRLLHR